MKLPFKAPENWKYSKTKFNSKFDAIWLISTRKWDYTNEEVKCIWGFVNLKTNKIHAPINAQKPGSVVELERTTPYTAMPLKLNPLEMALL